jgi:hypothetical protein
MKNAERTVDLHQHPRHPVQRVGPGTQNHAAGCFLERPEIRRDASLSFVQAQLEQHLDRPAEGDGGQRLEHMLDTIEVQRPRERFVA